jgi:hypothetical protein
MFPVRACGYLLPARGDKTCQPKWEINNIFHTYLEVDLFQEAKEQMTPDKVPAKTVSWQPHYA